MSLTDLWEHRICFSEWIFLLVKRMRTINSIMSDNTSLYRISRIGRGRSWEQCGYYLHWRSKKIRVFCKLENFQNMFKYQCKIYNILKNLKGILRFVKEFLRFSRIFAKIQGEIRKLYKYVLQGVRRAVLQEGSENIQRNQ